MLKYGNRDVLDRFCFLVDMSDAVAEGAITAGNAAVVDVLVALISLRRKRRMSSASRARSIFVNESRHCMMRSLCT